MDSLNFPTRGQNTLDIFLTNRPSMVTSSSPTPGISDHEAVLVYSATQIDLRTSRGKFTCGTS